MCGLRAAEHSPCKRFYALQVIRVRMREEMCERRFPTTSAREEIVDFEW